MAAPGLKPTVPASACGTTFPLGPLQAAKRIEAAGRL